MKKHFELYVKLRRAIQDWILDQGSVMEIAHLLEVTSTSLQELLGWNGLADVNGRPEFGIDVQDVFNLLFLVYTLSNRELLREGVLNR